MGKPEVEVLQSIQRNVKEVAMFCVVLSSASRCCGAYQSLLFFSSGLVFFSPIFHLELHLFMLVYPAAPFSCFLSFLIKDVAIEVEHFCRYLLQSWMLLAYRTEDG